MKEKKEITLARLRSVLQYDSNSGVFRWLLKPKHWTIQAGDIAGSLNSNGYIRITIDGVRYGAHRLAWFHFYGMWPEYQIDHINGARSDNSISNLRDVTRSINMQNIRSPYSTNKTKLLGVCAKGSGWMAQIRSPKKNIFLGVFATAELAHEAYITAKRSIHIGGTL